MISCSLLLSLLLRELEMVKLVILLTFFFFLGKWFLCNITSFDDSVAPRFFLWLYFVLIFYISLSVLTFSGCSWIPCGGLAAGGDGRSTRICDGQRGFKSLAREQ